jgi:hypothetical protein
MPKKSKKDKVEEVSIKVESSPEPIAAPRPAHRLSPEVLLNQLDEILNRLDVIEKALKLK